jgi:hypothetical protein
MEIEQATIDLLRLGAFAASFILVPRHFIKVKIAWDTGNHEQLKRSITFVWFGIICGLFALKTVGR